MRLLSSGSVGEDVKKLQARLNEIYPDPPVAVDGNFGPITRHQVINYQRDQGLGVDGVVGPKTWMSLFGEALPGQPELPEIEGQDPSYLKWALGKVGVIEVPGSGDNPEIVGWLKLTDVPKSMWHDATAWCASFETAMFDLNGVDAIHSARAVDWLEFGYKVATPVRGAVVVFDWGNGGHHVATVLRDLGDQLECIGGNQGRRGEVSITHFPKAAVMGYRVPA